MHLAPGPVLRRARVGIAGAQGDREAEGPRFADRRLDEAGLPDARLAADQEDATPAARGVREAGAQRAELALAPDEGDVGHARRYARRPRFGRARDGVDLHRPARGAGTVTAPGRASGPRSHPRRTFTL